MIAYLCAVPDQSGVCLEWVEYNPPTHILPPMSLQEGALLLSAFAVLLAVAYGWRLVRQSL